MSIKTNIAIYCARQFGKLPGSFILMSGRFLGLLTWLLPNKRKKIAARNIELCFPEMSLEEQKALLKNNLISTGRGFAENLMAHWSKSSAFLPRVRFSGREHLEDAFSQNKGCILLSCHLHSVELSIRAINLTMENEGHMLARQHNNKVLESYIDKARRTHCHKTIDKKDIRAVMKSLKSNHGVYYIPDQNFSYQCLYIDFFGQPASTLVSTVRLAQSSKATVIPWFGFYKNNGWHISFLPAVHFDKNNSMEYNLKKMNTLFEQQILKHPEQYLWVHRRFKNHPQGKNHVYKDL